MTQDRLRPEDDLEFLRTAIHDLNNRVGVVLATAELLQMDPADPKIRTRSELVETKALEARQILQRISDRYFG